MNGGCQSRYRPVSASPYWTTESFDIRPGKNTVQSSRQTSTVSTSGRRYFSRLIV